MLGPVCPHMYVCRCASVVCVCVCGGTGARHQTFIFVFIFNSEVPNTLSPPKKGLAALSYISVASNKHTQAHRQTHRHTHNRPDGFAYLVGFFPIIWYRIPINACTFTAVIFANLEDLGRQSAHCVCVPFTQTFRDIRVQLFAHMARIRSYRCVHAHLYFLLLFFFSLNTYLWVCDEIYVYIWLC